VAILQTLSPGVYGFEKAPSRAPEGVSPAKAAFVGWTDEGPSNTPIEVRSFEEFDRVFGGISTLGLVPIEVHAFFATGGERCFIVRSVPSDAVSAWVNVDEIPGPTKWTFTSNGEGLWGNDTVIRIRGNRNFLDRTVGAEAWEKFDVLVLRPSDFDANIQEAKETFEAVQFDDADASDYISAVMNDPRAPSIFVELTEGAGGTPSGLLATQVADEIAIPAASVDGILVNFTGTLASAPVLDGSLQIVAADAQIDDEVQSPAPDGGTDGFNFALPIAPVLDGSLRLFFQQPSVIAEAPALAAGTVGVDVEYQIAAGALTAPVHRENTVFRIRFAKTAPSVPENIVPAVSGPNPLDLSLLGGAQPIGVSIPLTDTPVHPGTLSIAVDEDGLGATTIIDDGNGNLIGGTPTILPLGGTINYDTGAMTGITANLANASVVVATYSISGVITKAASADNLAQGVALAGDINPTPTTATNSIHLVDSVSAPTGNGLIFFETDTVPLALTSIYVDFAPLGIVNSNVAGVLSGDLGAADITYTNTVDFSTGDVSVKFLPAPANLSTIDADYQTGQVAQDDGLGNLVGAVDPAATNTIDYASGTFDITWDSPPTANTDILANYVNLAPFVDYPLAGGLNGSAVSRNDISAASLEAGQTGIYALDKVEEPTNIVVPDFEGSEFVQFDIIQYCRNRSDERYAIMCAANGTTRPEIIQYIQVTQAWDEKIAAFYYPNIFYVNPTTDRVELIPVSGFAAGVYSKTANRKNIGKSPGGVDDGALDGVGTVGAEFKLDQADRDALYQSRINPIISSQATGLAVWGVRSLSKEIRWRYVNARQLHNFLMYTTSLNLQWAVFENNGPPLWIRIETALKGYYGSLFRLGYFKGEVEEEAFFVKCNATNNNDATVAEGKVIIDIGFSPNIPAEFITFTLQQPVGQTTEQI
jgi:hypothetical protein